ncbi:RNA 2',3'-cyclic phosphodiesterase [Archangium primigenium]|uniref:RNA 2',3'-cyclic phosphodiesterase n=1 Tax=[Archangium] primigenium TaxID=2792470 RepID=UPI0019564562|nr:RNA 2',3'-cyclic phosphodiesterase [Archangium primigenium]MBM7113283.1 RNA 2',3'-cyclic phosphodiesterase [Archangium primigenium]
MRLFVAVTLGPALEATVTDALRDLSRHAPRARWVPPANLHLTLSFLGDVDAPRAAEVERVLRPVGAAHAPLELSVQGGGGFGAPERPRVLWAGVGGDTAALGALQADVAAALGPLGFEPEHREYVAHLTLARARSPGGDRELAACVQALQAARWGTARVERVVLFESQGGRYHPRADFPLGTP